jgi:hypothetical protein
MRGGDEGTLKTQGVALGYCFQAFSLFKSYLFYPKGRLKNNCSIFAQIIC